jgi:hypothetical protein
MEYMPGNGQIRGSEDDIYSFHVVLTRLDDIVYASEEIGSDAREGLEQLIAQTRGLLDRKKIRFLQRRRWLRTLRRELQGLQATGLDAEAAQKLRGLLSAFYDKLERLADR